jgi:hypothetical protein
VDRALPLPQDSKGRRAIAQLKDPALRLKAARKILRDGHDVTCIWLFRACREADPAERWGDNHPLDAVRGAVRFRALRTLGRPSKLQGLDHHEAAQLLPWIIKPRDQVILFRQLQTGKDARILPALRALQRVVAELDPIDDDLLTAIVAMVADPAQSTLRHAALASMLAAWPDDRAIVLLRDGAGHEAHVIRWPYIAAMLERDPAAEGFAMAEELLDRVGPHHLLAAEVAAAIRDGRGTP